MYLGNPLLHFSLSFFFFFFRVGKNHFYVLFLSLLLLSPSPARHRHPFLCNLYIHIYTSTHPPPPPLPLPGRDPARSFPATKNFWRQRHEPRRHSSHVLSFSCFFLFSPLFLSFLFFFLGGGGGFGARPTHTSGNCLSDGTGFDVVDKAALRGKTVGILALGTAGGGEEGRHRSHVKRDGRKKKINKELDQVLQNKGQLL